MRECENRLQLHRRHIRGTLEKFIRFTCEDYDVVRHVYESLSAIITILFTVSATNILRLPCINAYNYTRGCALRVSPGKTAKRPTRGPGENVHDSPTARLTDIKNRVHGVQLSNNIYPSGFPSRYEIFRAGRRFGESL